MRIQLAFITVIAIWSTTPLAIKWSIEDVGFLFGSTSRMIVGGILSVLAVLLFRYPYGFSRESLLAYLASGLGIYIAMLFGYWGAMYVPSGWISVIWGLSPIFMGIFAYRILKENALTRHRIVGALLGVSGLGVIFLHGSSVGKQTALGVILLLTGVLGQTGTAVWIKHINAKINGLVMSAGGLVVSIPMFVMTWWIFDGHFPDHIGIRVAGSILYLAFFGSVIGFSAYYYLLNHVEASRVSLITLITPVTALLLGHYLNKEALGVSVIVGTGLILLGLLSYEWGGKLVKMMFDSDSSV